jgi:hypothetical protein
MRARRVLAALVVACLLPLIASASSAQTTPTVTVTPSTGLVDGQNVMLAGSGFPPSDTVFFCQAIESGTPDPGDCGVPFASVLSNDAGEFTATYTVHRFMEPASIGTVIDCAQPSANCVIGAIAFLTSSDVAIAPLTFAQQEPTTFTVTPDTGLNGGDAVTVGGSGFSPSMSLQFCQALAASGSCGVPATTVSADSNGEFSAMYTVQRYLALGNGVMFDCAAQFASCAMVLLAPNGLLIGSIPLAFVAQPPTTTPIRGTVTGPSGAPIAGANVWVYTRSDTWVGSLRTVTDAQGAYSFSTAQPGVEYRILFSYPSGSGLVYEWYDDTPTRQLATPFTLHVGDFLVANAQLEDGGSIAGTVTNAAGAPAAGVSVYAYIDGDTWVGSSVATTASDGSYVVGNIRPGSTHVFFIPSPSSGLRSEWYDDATSRGSGTVVTVTAGQTVGGINAQLATAP